MLYIKSVTINKFKSFSHADLLLNKGFTCVIGPNGSGKSTICDALLFALGENSSKRLRVARYDQLIRASKVTKDQLRVAYVKLEFSGDEDLSVTRYTRSDGKTMYKVNGKHMKRHEVLELLAKHGITADETNTIVQGEISSMASMSPNELRQLIEIASGIREFEYKKDESLKELEKVNQKISESKIMLSERSGFLSELAAEKEAAEKYLQMSSRLKSLTFSVLFGKKEDSDKSLSQFTTDLAIADGKEKSASMKLVSLNGVLDGLNADRQKLTKQLSESTDTMGSTKARLDSINIQIAKGEAEIAGMLASIDESKKIVTSTNHEVHTNISAIKTNDSKIKAQSALILPIEAEIKKAKIKPEDFKSDPDRIKHMGADVEKIEQNVSLLLSDISKANSDLAVLKNANASRETQLVSSKEQLEKQEHELADLEKSYSEFAKKAKELGQRSVSLQSEMQKSAERLSKIDTELIQLSEQRAYAQPRSQSLLEKLSSKFVAKDGFYGKASDLCTYSTENAYAVEAAAGGRFENFVVDSIDTANDIISYMKTSGLGRATFIPIKEIREQRETDAPKGLKPALQLVSFDSKFQKVFAYIFGNTYVVDSIVDAKRNSIGRNRYVTMDGDIVEQSGVVSGGSQNKRVSVSLINSKIQALNLEKTKLNKIRETTEVELLDARKGAAISESEASASKNRLNLVAIDTSSVKKMIAEITSSITTGATKETSISKKLAELESSKASTEKKLDEAKKRMEQAVNETVEISKKLAAGGVTKEEIERIENKRKELETLKISKAELERENQMLESRNTELLKQIEERTASIKNLEKDAKKKKEEKDALAVSRGEIELKISSASEDSKKVYARISMLDKEIEKAGTEKGKLTAELSTYERQVSELRLRRQQVETTLKDLSAELSLYKDMEPVKASLQEMEKESIILNAKIKDLGNVNLKAPEMYGDKARDVEEAKSKVETLETEQLAIRRMLEEIESKKLQTFMSTFNDVVVNFMKFSTSFFADKPSIALTNPTDPFNGGLDITITEGKTRKHISSLSGGEKSLVLLLLIFSILMCKPSSLYIFDEVDAALDKENATKLSNLVKQMSTNAQFVVVSHNDSLITNADVAIGVVKTEGESKAVGLEVSGLLSKSK